METSDQGLLGKRGYFCSQQIILQIYRLVFESLCILLTSPGPRTRSSQKCSKTSHKLYKERSVSALCDCFTVSLWSLLHWRRHLTVNPYLHLTVHPLIHRVDFYNTAFSLSLVFSAFSLLFYFSALKDLSPFSCSSHGNNTTSLSHPFSIFSGPIYLWYVLSEKENCALQGIDIW